MSFFEAWLMTRFSGVPISARKLWTMQKVNADFGAIVHSLIVYHKGRLKYDIDRIIDHWKDGGDPRNIVYGLLLAKKNNISMNLTDAIAKDINGIDIPKEITGKGLNEK